MDLVDLAALILAGLSVLLLIMCLVQLRGLAALVREGSSKDGTAHRVRKDNAAASDLAQELRAIEAQIGRFDIVFSEVQRQLDMLVRQVRAGAPAGSPALPVGRPQLASSTPSMADPREVGEREGLPFSSFQVPAERGYEAPISDSRGPPAGATAAPPSDTARLETLVNEYRDLIAQPRKTEINRWSDESGGWACELNEDGTLLPLGRDAGGLLTLVPGRDGTGALLPGGRLVVDFATSFADVISMRRVTRQSFELISDGSGLLRLIEPAWAQKVGDKWQLVRPGALAGLKSD